jgi:hypothetical protein
LEFDDQIPQLFIEQVLGVRTGNATDLVRMIPDYPLLLDALKSLIAKSFVIDGEIAALDQNGRSSFQLLQSYEIRSKVGKVKLAVEIGECEGAGSQIRLARDMRSY